MLALGAVADRDAGRAGGGDHGDGSAVDFGCNERGLPFTIAYNL